MKFDYLSGNLSRYANGDWGLLITIPNSESYLMEELNKIVSDDKIKTVEIKHKTKSRSLDANAALWQMLSMMAVKLNTTKDALYLEVLDRYGVFTHIIVKENMVDRIINEWRTVRILGEITVNGKTGIQMQCFFGSSTYDKKEFSVLLDGVIQEAKEIGIQFISQEDQARMISEWGNNDDKITK